MQAAVRQIVRYNNRKLYEPAERRFVTIHDLARTVAHGGRVEVRAAATGENITATILSRALASEKTPVPASTDALTRILRAGSEAAGTVADVMERVGGTQMAATVRRAAAPDKLAETISPVTRRIETARQEVERIVGSLVGRGRLTWEEGARLKDDVGAVFRESLSDVLGRVRELHARILPRVTPEMAREIGDLRARLDQLEALAAASFPEKPASPASPAATTPRNHNGSRPKQTKQAKPRKKQTRKDRRTS